MICWISSVLFFGLLYLFECPVELIAAILIFYLLTVSIVDNSSWELLYFGMAVNLCFVFLSLLVMDGQVSYLTEHDFMPYYGKAFFLESVFWVTFSSVVMAQRNKNMRFRLESRLPAAGYSGMQYAFVLALLIFEVIYSSGTYFVPYVDAYDTGTVAYELGCLLLALTIVNRSKFSISSLTLIFEVLCVLLSLYVAIASGKRLPFSYVIIAYLFKFSQYYGGLRTAIIYLAIFVAGYIFGIVRDLMKIDGFDMAMFADGLGSTNQGAVLHASSVYIRIVDEGLISYMDRLVSFMGNVFGSLLFPISYLPEQVQVNVFSMQHYPVQGNGGFIGSYCYYFLGYPGVFILSALLAKLCTSRGYWIELVAMMILLTSPRWTLYNVGPVVRLISMALIIIFVLQMLTKMRLGKSSIEK